MGLSDLWKRGINTSGVVGAIDIIWLVLIRLEIILFFVFLIVAIISLITADRVVVKTAESFGVKVYGS